MSPANPYPEEAPAIEVAGLRIWVRGRQYPDAADYWDGNWLIVSAIYQSPGSTVKTAGPIIHLSEIEALQSSCEILRTTLTGTAGLSCMEPELSFEVRAVCGGRMELSVSITPNAVKESHEFREEIDQSHLSLIISACRKVLNAYPIRKVGSEKQ